MDRALKEQLGEAAMRFRKSGMPLHCGRDLHMGELMIMKRIAMYAGDPEKNASASDLQNNLYMTKPAVSQILNSLEKKGYISREIDRNDRRRIAVSLTEEGLCTLKDAREQTDRMFDAILSRLGEENIRQLIDLLTRMAEISEELRREKAEKEGPEGEITHEQTC
jgi:DNA-binding MarR family transcriptional regulator